MSSSSVAGVIGVIGVVGCLVAEKPRPRPKPTLSCSSSAGVDDYVNLGTDERDENDLRAMSSALSGELERGMHAW